jgi:hypothetical protein
MKMNKCFSKISIPSLLVLSCFLTTSVSSGQRLKILPLGNSITFGENMYQTEQSDPEICIGYRKVLYDLLIAEGYTFDYVGSQKSGWDAGLPSNPVDSLDYTNNAGFPGIDPTQLTTLLRTSTNPVWDYYCEISPLSCPQNYLAVYDPDIILLHIGTNYLTDNSKAILFRDSVNAMLDFIDAYEASVGKTIPVFLAQIINRASGSGNPEHAPTSFYNDLLYTMANNRTGDEVIVVDMENITGFDYRIGEDMIDDLHPSVSGNTKMAEKWFEHLEYYNFRAPVISNIPNVTILENETFKTINLNNYVFDPQDPDSEITWSFTPGSPVHFNISIASGIATISSKNPEWSGSETITFKAEDSGNGSTPLFDTDAVIITAENVNDTPVIQSQQPISGQEDSQIAIQFSDLNVVDPDNNYPADFTLHVNPGSNYTVLGTNTVKPNSNYYGTLTVPVYVNDGLANSNTYNLTVSVTAVNDNPWMTIPVNRVAVEGILFSMTLTAGDVDVGDYLTFSSVEVPNWLSFNASSGLLSGTPHNDDVGLNQVTIRVNDGTVNVDSTFSLMVNNTNDSPVITSYPESTVIFVDDYFEYCIMAEDSDVYDILTYSVAEIPSFLEFDQVTHILSGTPQSDDIGTHDVSLKVSDGTAIVYQDFDLKVEIKTYAPEVTSVHITTAKEDSLYLYALKAKDPDNDILTFGAVKIPDWTDFYSTGILIGTPTNSDVGFHEIKLSVTDGIYTVYDSFNIEVINVNDPPVIIGTSKALFTPEDTPLEIALGDLVVEDVDNIYPNDFSMKLYDGTNYTVTNLTVIPNTSFLGILDVYVAINDGLDSASAFIPVYVGVSSAENDYLKDNSLKIYPVPASKNITFMFNGLNDNAVITLYNSTMQFVKYLNIPARTEELMLDIQELPAGIVFYRVIYKNGYDTGSFIIAR